MLLPIAALAGLIAETTPPGPGEGVWKAVNREPAPFIWNDAPPPDCPLEPSKAFDGLRFTGRYANYTTADGHPRWSKDFADTQPLIDWNNHAGCVTATYVPGLDKYLMCVTDGWPTTKTMDSYILKADRIEGPWRMVAYMKEFGPQAYFLNFPSKFISQDGKRLWLCSSGHFTQKGKWTDPDFYTTNRPPGSTYALCLHELDLVPWKK